jgi:2-haloacid dehalogenase
MAQTDDLRASIKVCMFDQYGTVVDMQGGLTKAAAPFRQRRGGRATPVPS